jgi:hypothetical protein
VGYVFESFEATDDAGLRTKQTIGPLLTHLTVKLQPKVDIITEKLNSVKL